MFPRTIGWLIIPLLLVSLLFTGCGSDSSAAKETQEPAVKPHLMVVETITMERREISDHFTLPGTVEAWEDLLLAAELAGPIRWIGPEEGAALEKGEEILRIDTETVRANLQRDRTAFELQQQEFARYQKLLAEQLVSQQEFERVKNALEAARANLRQSELALDKSTCSSPVDGILDRLLVDRGEYVSPGDPLAEVVRVDRLKVLVDVPEKDVVFLRPGQQVKVLAASLEDNGQQTLAGEILHVGYQANPASRTYRVKIAIDNPDGRFRPGMILRARFLRQQHREVIAVPLYALIDQQGEQVVYVVRDGRAEKRTVSTGAVIGQQVLVSEGLGAGDRLVVKGHQLLSDGDRVDVREP